MPAVGPFHLGYACKSYNNLLFGGRLWKAGDRVMNKQFVAEILEVSQEERRARWHSL